MPRKATPPEMVTPLEAAKRLGINVDYLRAELRKGTFPIGFAYNPSGKQWVYCIPRPALENLMVGNMGIDIERIASIVAEKVLERLSETQAG